MNKTFRISFALRITYKVNSIIYSLRQLPLIKKLLPSSLYASQGLKFLAVIIAVIWELLSAFLGKLLYFLLMIAFMAEKFQELGLGAVFLHILLFLSLIGALMNTYMFNPSKDKYYGVILMRMDARQFAVVDYAYAMTKLIVGFLVFGTIFGRSAGLPLWVCLLTPFSVAGLKACIAAYFLRRYEKTGISLNENLPGKYIWWAAAGLLAAAYGLPALGVVLPGALSLAIMALFIPAGLIATRKICSFQYYRPCYQQILKPVDPKAMAAQANREQSDKLISNDLKITSRRRGFEYMNELFIKRHRKLLWQASRRIALVCLLVLAAALLVLELRPELCEPINGFLTTGLPVFVIIMYMINRGTSFTRVLFMNCDHSLLTYSFYKKPDFVLRLFAIRLREITKVNLLPALIIGPGLALLLYCSGGTDKLLNYAVLALSMPALSMFFSVHYLMAYYLFQPYTAGTELKGSAYQLICTGTYLVCFYIMRLEISSLMFGVMTLVFCLAYSLLACLLVYRLSPKTFRLRT